MSSQIKNLILYFKLINNFKYKSKLNDYKLENVKFLNYLKQKLFNIPFPLLKKIKKSYFINN